MSISLTKCVRLFSATSASNPWPSQSRARWSIRLKGMLYQVKGRLPVASFASKQQCLPGFESGTTKPFFVHLPFCEVFRTNGAVATHDEWRDTKLAVSASHMHVRSTGRAFEEYEFINSGRSVPLPIHSNRGCNPAKRLHTPDFGTEKY